MLIEALLSCFPKYSYLKELKETEKTYMDKKNKRRDLSLHSAQTMKGDDFDISRDGGSLPEIKEEVNHKKKKICEIIYQNLISICEKNNENKSYIFKFLPVFQLHADFIPFSISCINKVLKDNEALLLLLHKTSSTVETQGDLKIVTTFSISDKYFRGKKTKGASRAPRSGQVTLDTCTVMVRVDEKFYYQAYEKYFDDKINDIILRPEFVFNGWNYLQFFAILLKLTKNIANQKNLVDFFRTISKSEGQGLNVNQGSIHEYFILSEAETSCIINTNIPRIFCKDDKVYVTTPFAEHQGKEYELSDFVGLEHNTINFDEEDDSEYLDIELEPILNQNQELVISHIDFCAAMCLSRNYIWKAHFEKDYNWETMLNQLESDLPSDVKAAIVRLMSALFVDQEPRREQHIPALCKVCDKSKLSDDKKNDEPESKKDFEYLDDDSVLSTHKDTVAVNIDEFKVRFQKHLSKADEIVPKLPLELKVLDYMKYQTALPLMNELYNSHILEIIEVFQMLLKFQTIPIKTHKITINPPEPEPTLGSKLKKGLTKNLTKVSSMLTTTMKK